MSWILILGNLVKNSRIPSVENNFKEIGRIEAYYLDQLDFLLRLTVQGCADAQIRIGVPPPQYMFHVKIKVYIFIPKFQCNFCINFNPII